MNVLVVFPKAECYVGKSIDVKRIYDNTMNKYIAMLKEAKCSIEYLLEDELAGMMLKDYPCELVSKYKTCIAPSDIKFFFNYKDAIKFPSYVYEHYDKCESYTYESEAKYTVPIELVRESKELYMEKKIEACRKRLRYATDKFIKEHKNVLMFRMDNNTDRCTALRDTIVEGDGRLCIEVNLNSNLAVPYYGGVYIPENHLPTILSL